MSTTQTETQTSAGVASATQGAAQGAAQSGTGGMTPADFRMDQGLETAAGRQREIESTGDWDAEGDLFLTMLNDNSSPNGDTGLHPSPQNQLADAHGDSNFARHPDGQQTASPNGNATPVQDQQTTQQNQQIQQVPQNSTQQNQQTAHQQPAQLQTAPQTIETLESLRAELAQLQEVKTFMQTQEYRDSQLVMKGFRENPKEFYRKYLPGVYAEIEREDAVMGSQPEDYARQYMEQTLASKYGNAMAEYDPSEALVPGTTSYNIATDRQLLLNRGLQEFYSERARIEHEQRTAIERGKAVGRAMLADFRVPEDKFDAVTAVMNGIEMTPEIQFRMAYLYLDSIGKLNEFKSQPPSQQAPPAEFRPSQERPIPGVHQIAGGETASRAGESMQDVFPLDFILSDLP